MSMDAKLFFACLALGSLVSCAASAPAGPSPAADFASHDLYVGKEFWSVVSFKVSPVPDILKADSVLPAGTHFKVDGIEQGIIEAGGITSRSVADFYYRMVLDDGRTVYLYSPIMRGAVSDGPPDNLAKVPDREIVDRIIHDSRQSYAGQCACPNDRTYNGRACGGRSAYSQKRGIKCYPSDVSKDEIAAYRARLHFRSVQ